MAKLRHIICAFLICFLYFGGSACAQNGPEYQNPPAARLIRPRNEFRPFERVRPRFGPLDDRCRLIKDQLEGALQNASNPRRAFQAHLAHNAGTRLCREGQVEKGIAEFQKGLSLFPDNRRP